MGDWVCLQLCEFQYDTVLCADARVLTEQHFIEALRQAGYADMLQKNNAICLDVNKRAAMARWRAAHPGYMANAAREHRMRRADKLREQLTAAAQEGESVEVE